MLENKLNAYSMMPFNSLKMLEKIMEKSMFTVFKVFLAVLLSV